MTVNVHLRKVGEKQYMLFKSKAAKRSISLSKAFEEAVSTWMSVSEETSDEQTINDMTYRKMKKQLEQQFPGRYAVIAGGEFLGVKDSLESAWDMASSYDNALVTKIIERPLRTKLLGSSLRMVARKTV